MSSNILRNALAFKESHRQDALARNRLAQFRMDREEQDRQNKLASVVGNRLASGDMAGAREAAFRGGNIDAGLKIGQQATDARNAAFDGLATISGQLLSLPQEQMQGAYVQALPQIHELLRGAGIQFDPNDTTLGDDDIATMRAFAARGGKLPKAPKTEPLVEIADPKSPTGTRFVTRTDAVDKPGKPPSGQSDRFKDETSLRKELAARQKDFKEQERAWARIQASTQSPSPAGDMALIFNFMKMMDPGSVVRESEFRTAALAGSFGDRIQASVAQVVSGKRLSDDQRADFLKTAQTIFQNSQRVAQRDTDFFRSLASQAGIDPDRIVNPKRGSSPRDDTQGGQGGSAGNNDPLGIR